MIIIADKEERVAAEACAQKPDAHHGASRLADPWDLGFKAAMFS